MSVDIFPPTLADNLNLNQLVMHEDKEYEPFPDLRDPVTGDWLPMSESDMKRKDEADFQRKMSNADISSMISAILK